MTYEVIIDSRFDDELLAFSNYLAERKGNQSDFDLVASEIDDLIDKIAESPRTFAYFHLLGAPFRACLYRYNSRQTYWLIYVVDESARAVRLLSFWHAMREPGSLPH